MTNTALRAGNSNSRTITFKGKKHGKTLAEFETETRRRIYEENKRREREAWEKAWNQLNN